MRINTTHADTTALFGEVDRQYRARGYTHADYEVLESRSLGANSVFATIRWAYSDAAGATIWQTTFAYNLYKRDNAWKILLQTMHDD